MNSGGNDGGFRTEPGEHLVVVREGAPGENDPSPEIWRRAPTLSASDNTGETRATVLTVTGRDVAHTLTADGSDGSEDGTGRGTPIVATGHAGHAAPEAPAAVVRRLTPLECERLQGFPDGWTDVPGSADSARYKQCGNAVTVSVFEWVIGRLVEVDARGGV